MRATIILSLILLVCGSATSLGQQMTVTGTPTLPRTQQQQQPPTQPELKPEDYAKVEGTVYDARTGSPLGKAQLALYGADRSRRKRLGTVTDASGHFLFDKVEPGKYHLSVRRNRYARQSYGQKSPSSPGTVLSVSKGQHIKDIIFRLQPGAVVTGQVVDEDGEPMPYVMISAMKYRYLRGKRELIPAGGIAYTNDLGEYRLFGVPPGKYYIQAVSRSRMMMGGVTRMSSAGKKEESSYPTLFYPGVLDPSQTTPIELRAGEERGSIDFRLTRVRAVHVKGRVIAGLGRLPTSVMITLTSREGGFSSLSQRYFNAVDSKTGEFELRGVQPGSYMLNAMTRNADGRLFARQPLDIGSENIEGVTLVLAPGRTVSGQITWDGQPPRNAVLSELRVTLAPKGGGFYGYGQGLVHEDGSFSAENMAPGAYQITVRGMPPDAYLKEVRYGDQDVLASGLNLEQGGGASLKVVIGLKGGTISGSAVDKTHQPQQGATVVLVPEKSKRNRDDLFKTANTDQYGHFTLRGIAPGEYRIYAFDDIERGVYQDPAFLEQYKDDGEKVEIEEGDSRIFELEVIQTTKTQS